MNHVYYDCKGYLVPCAVIRIARGVYTLRVIESRGRYLRGEVFEVNDWAIIPMGPIHSAAILTKMGVS